MIVWAICNDFSSSWLFVRRLGNFFQYNNSFWMQTVTNTLMSFRPGHKYHHQGQEKPKQKRLLSRCNVLWESQGKQKRHEFSYAVCSKTKPAWSPARNCLDSFEGYRLHKTWWLVESCCTSSWKFYNSAEHVFEDSMVTCFNSFTDALHTFAGLLRDWFREQERPVDESNIHSTYVSSK